MKPGNFNIPATPKFVELLWLLGHATWKEMTSQYQPFGG